MVLIADCKELRERPVGTVVTMDRLAGRLTAFELDGRLPGRPPIGSASQTLIALGPPPAWVGSPPFGVIHCDSFGTPTGAVLLQ